MSTTITNATELQAITNDLDGDYVLGNNINAAETSSWNSGAGFAPIGTYDTDPFIGTFDGAGYTISGLFINRPTENVGMFEYTDGATIEDVALTSADITGGDWVGGLVCVAQDTNISNCSVSGSVTASVYSAGGFCCYFVGSAITPTISNCYSTGTVTGVTNAGGLCYAIMAAAEKSYSSANVIVSAAVDYGGAGFAFDIYLATITDCYATGSVTSNQVAAGFGYIYAVGSLITNCYSTGLLTSGTSDVYGFMKATAGGAGVNACFWDTQTSGTESSDVGTGKTTAQMKTKSTFTAADWDFVDIWDILSTVNSGYPYLRTISRVYTTPRIYDRKGRVPKGARVIARRNDTGIDVETQTLDENGQATFTNLPNDVGISFYASWGGRADRPDMELLYSTIIGISEGGTGSSDAATARQNLGLEIGVNVQAWDNDLDDIAALTPTDSNFIVGNNTDWVAESGNTARTSLGLGTGNSPQFTAVNIGHASDTTMARVEAGKVSVEGKVLTRMAAQVVAANDSYIKTQADLTCDGTDD